MIDSESRPGTEETTKFNNVTPELIIHEKLLLEQLQPGTVGADQTPETERGTKAAASISKLHESKGDLLDEYTEPGEAVSVSDTNGRVGAESDEFERANEWQPDAGSKDLLKLGRSDLDLGTGAGLHSGKGLDTKRGDRDMGASPETIGIDAKRNNYDSSSGPDPDVTDAEESIINESL